MGLDVFCLDFFEAEPVSRLLNVLMLFGAMFPDGKDKLRVYVSDICADEELFLYDLERCSGDVLKIAVLKEDKSSPSVGDCSRLARRLSTALFAEASSLGVSDDLELDVSSPGLDRRLRTLEHYELALGKEVKLVCNSDAVSGGVVQGVLKSLEGGVLTVDTSVEVSSKGKAKGQKRKKKSAKKSLEQEEPKSSEETVKDSEQTIEFSNIIKSNLVFRI